MRMQFCKKCYVPMVGVMSFSKTNMNGFVGVLIVIQKQDIKKSEIMN